MHWLLDVRYREDYLRAQNENIQKNMNMSRKLALNLARVYKNKHAKKTPLSHIIFDCLMDPYHLLTVLGKNFSSVPRIQGFSMKEKYSKVMLWWKGYYLNK